MYWQIEQTLRQADTALIFLSRMLFLDTVCVSLVCVCVCTISPMNNRGVVLAQREQLFLSEHHQQSTEETEAAALIQASQRKDH